MNLKNVASILGLLMVLNGGFMLLGLPFSWYFNESLMPLLVSGLGTSALGLFVWQFFRRQSKKRELTKKDGYLVVTFGWLTMSFFGMFPFLLSGAMESLTAVSYTHL